MCAARRWPAADARSWSDAHHTGGALPRCAARRWSAANARSWSDVHHTVEPFPGGPHGSGPLRPWRWSDVHHTVEPLQVGRTAVARCGCVPLAGDVRYSVEPHSWASRRWPAATVALERCPPYSGALPSWAARWWTDADACRWWAMFATRFGVARERQSLLLLRGSGPGDGNGG
jgi:hypothetical protein